MVLQAHQTADVPMTGRARPTRRRPARDAGYRETGESVRFLGISGATLTALFVASLMTPIAIRVGDIRIAPYTVLMILLLGPMMLSLLRDRGRRLVALDWLILAHVFWMALAMFTTEGLGRAVFIVNTTITSLGGYMMGRTLIRGPEDYERFFRYIFWGLLFWLPFAIVELLTARTPLRDVLRLVFEVTPRPANTRMGLNRVQAFAEHPITFGLFCSVTVANLYYIYRDRWFKRLTRTGTALLMTLLSLSSAPTIAVALQFLLIAFDRILRLPYKWVMLVLVASLTLAVLQLASPNGLLGLLIDNLSYNPTTGWDRTEIFRYGSAEVLRHPLFGIGFRDWIRPFWRNASVDNHWLVIAMRWGLPALLLLVAGIAIHATRIMAQTLPEALTGYRAGYLLAGLGLLFVLCTVAVWGVTSVLFMTYIGAGVWLYTAPETRPPARPRRVRELEEAGAAARAAQPSAQAASAHAGSGQPVPPYRAARLAGRAAPPRHARRP